MKPILDFWPSEMWEPRSLPSLSSFVTTAIGTNILDLIRMRVGVGGVGGQVMIPLFFFRGSIFRIPGTDEWDWHRLNPDCLTDALWRCPPAQTVDHTRHRRCWSSGPTTWTARDGHQAIGESGQRDKCSSISKGNMPCITTSQRKAWRGLLSSVACEKEPEIPSGGVRAETSVHFPGSWSFRGYLLLG